MVLHYKYFKIAFMIINSVLLFILVNQWFGRYSTALLSALFFGTIKSTADFLAHNYFIPLSLGVTLLILMCIFFDKWIRTKNHKWFVFLLINGLACFFCYPPSLIFFGFVAFFYLLLFKRDIIKLLINLKYIIVLGTAGILLLVYILLSGLDAQRLLFTHLWTPVGAKFSLLFFFGIIQSAFAFFGLLILFVKRKSKFLFVWFFFSLAQIYLFYVFKFTILVPFVRLFLFYLIGMSILAGLGASAILDSVLGNIRMKSIKLIALFALFIIVCLPVIASFNHELTYSRILDDDIYDSLVFIKEKYGSDHVVAADPLSSYSVYPLTGNYVSGLIKTNIYGGAPDVQSAFFAGNCEDKRNILTTSERDAFYPEFILSKDEINCEFLPFLYSNKGSFVYRNLISK